MVITPDYFLLIAIGSGLFIFITGAVLYTLGCTRWIKGLCAPPPPVPPEPEGDPKQADELSIISDGIPDPRFWRGRARLASVFSLPRPIGTGYYTNSPLWSVPPVIIGPSPAEILNFDQAFPPAEWMSGYLFGLQANLMEPPIETEEIVAFHQSQFPHYQGHSRWNIGDVGIIAEVTQGVDRDESGTHPFQGAIDTHATDLHDAAGHGAADMSCF